MSDWPFTWSSARAIALASRGLGRLPQLPAPVGRLVQDLGRPPPLGGGGGVGVGLGAGTAVEGGVTLVGWSLWPQDRSGATRAIPNATARVGRRSITGFSE